MLCASANAFAVAKHERKSGNLPEVLAWRELRKRPGGFKFRRQHPLGEFVLDFACLERRVAIEIDGVAHDRGDRPQRDMVRDEYVRSRGFSVVRLPARMVLTNLGEAIAVIVFACETEKPLHHRPAADGPPPRSGEVLEGSNP